MGFVHCWTALTTGKRFLPGSSDLPYLSIAHILANFSSIETILQIRFWARSMHFMQRKSEHMEICCSEMFSSTWTSLLRWLCINLSLSSKNSFLISSEYKITSLDVHVQHISNTEWILGVIFIIFNNYCVTCMYRVCIYDFCF